MESSLCRTCFSSINLINVLNVCSNNNKSISQMLQECCSIQINFDENILFMMCNLCIKLLHICYKFVLKCKETQQYFEQSNKIFEINTLNEDFKTKQNSNLPNGSINENEEIENLDEDYIENDKIDDFIKIDETPLSCDICNKNFETKIKLNRHKKTHLKYGCNQCPNVYSKKQTLDQHFQRVHMNVKSEIPCPQCNLKFTYRNNLSRHIKGVHEKRRPLSCLFCDKRFFQSSSLKSHLKTHRYKRSKRIGMKYNKRKTQPLSFRQKFTCNICKKYFFIENMYEKHLSDHNDPSVEKKICKICQIEYVDEESWKRHQVKVHEMGESTLALCPYCGIHVNDRNLKSHINRHTDERPYACQYCDRTFHNRTSHVVHERIHTNTRNYKCQQCGKCFIQNHHLKYHLKLHTGEKPYNCHVCNKSFALKRNMIQHARIHTGNKPFECEYCQERFYEACRLRKHMVKLHGDINEIK